MMLTAELTVAMSKYPMWLGGLSRPPLKPTHEPMVTATGVPPHVEDQQGRVGFSPPQEANRSSWASPSGVLADMCRDSSMGIP